MGSGASKSAAQSTIRKFPSRPPGSAVPPPSSGSSASRVAAASRRPPPSGRAQAPQASLAKDEAILRDGADPHMSSSPENNLQPGLAERLRQIGVVQPNPTYSPSSTASPTTSTPQPAGAHGEPLPGGGPVFPSPSNNAVLSALEARERLSREAEEEFESLGVSGGQGRRFLTSGMIRDVLVMRERGASDADIENRFNLRQGVVRRLGPRSLFQPVGGPAP